jgi:peptidoglycan/xylan/chitin deacetylase (PgdA/CDA1 family)
MRLISPALRHFIYPALAKSGYLRRRNGVGPTVVTYHGVLPAGYRMVDAVLDGNLVSTNTLRCQLQLLKSRYHVITPGQFLAWTEGQQQLPSRSVLLTCDDGPRSTLTDMLPVLQELELSCLFFVTGASLRESPCMLWHEEMLLMFLTATDACRLDLAEISVAAHPAGRQEKQLLWWDLVKKLSRYDESTRRKFVEKIRVQLGLPSNWSAAYTADLAACRRFLMLNGDELHSLTAAGMCVGAHTISHPMLSQSPEELSWNEISESRRGLESVLGERVWAMAYPFGDLASVTRRELEMAERAGYKCAFLNFGGGFGAQTARFAWPRVHVVGNISLPEFEAHVSGFYRWLREGLLGEQAVTGLGG